MWHCIISWYFWQQYTVQFCGNWLKRIMGEKLSIMCLGLMQTQMDIMNVYTYARKSSYEKNYNCRCIPYTQLHCFYCILILHFANTFVFSQMHIITCLVTVLFWSIACVRDWVSFSTSLSKFFFTFVRVESCDSLLLIQVSNSVYRGETKNRYHQSWNTKLQVACLTITADIHQSIKIYVVQSFW